MTVPETPPAAAPPPATPPRRGIDRFRPGRAGVRAPLRWLFLLLVGVLIGWLGTLVVQALILSAEPAGPFDPGAGPRNPDVTVTLSFELVAALIRQEMDTGTLPVTLKDVRTSDNDGRLQVRGAIVVLSRDIPVSVDLEPHIEDGKVKATVRRTRFAGLPIARNLERLAEDPLNRELNAILASLPATLTSVRVTDAGVVVSADVRIEELPFFQPK